MIQNLKGGQSEESKARLGKMNKALGFKTDKRTKQKGQKGDKRVRRAPRGGGGDMGLAQKIIDQDTGELSEFGRKLRANAPSVKAAMEKLKRGNQVELEDPSIKGKSMARREDDSDESDSDFSDDDALAAIRRKRVNELKIRSKLNEEWLKRGHGKYSEVHQDDFLPTVTESKHVVCHFYHKDFERCKIVDMHLAALGRKHVCAKFIKIDAQKCPFFVKKLIIRVLPTIIMFVDGVAKDRIVGFEELGQKDEFETIVLEERISKSGCIPKPPKAKKPLVFGAIRSGRNVDSDDDDL
mmetsp:Transcript_15735/g.23690  ORF Transcript_15735/g.23690 Transcript_15735/m.23690 type:complete len:296 (+) Transcript_15735:105-992(+)